MACALPDQGKHCWASPLCCKLSSKYGSRNLFSPRKLFKDVVSHFHWTKSRTLSTNNFVSKWQNNNLCDLLWWPVTPFWPSFLDSWSRTLPCDWQTWGYIVWGKQNKLALWVWISSFISRQDHDFEFSPRSFGLDKMLCARICKRIDLIAIHLK